MGDAELKGEDSDDPGGGIDMAIDIAARIRAVGEKTRRLDEKKRPVCKVCCQGCGKELWSDDSLSDVEYVKTKRGTELFFRTDCMDDVWKRGIV